ncbi:MAG TPA: GNAT family N-acetyltransferase [Dehalococcoidia bacterium]|nr:GNAT family N-acetyltransferase [Dehalococcoidia bacterium]
MNRDFVIEEVSDLEAAWPDLEPLLLEQHEYHLPFVGHDLLPDWAARARAYYAAQKPALILFAKNKGRAIGFMNGRIVRDPEVFKEVYGFIDNAYVRPEWRGSGAGRAMLRQAEAWFSRHDLDEVRLTTHAANKLGVRFWTLSGYGLQSMTMRKSLTGARQ